MWNLKCDTNELICNMDSQTWRTDCGLPTITYIGWINKKVILYSTGNYNQ